MLFGLLTIVTVVLGGKKYYDYKVKEGYKILQKIQDIKPDKIEEGIATLQEFETRDILRVLDKIDSHFSLIRSKIKEK